MYLFRSSEKHTPRCDQSFRSRDKETLPKNKKGRKQEKAEKVFRLQCSSDISGGRGATRRGGGVESQTAVWL